MRVVSLYVSIGMILIGAYPSVVAAETVPVQSTSQLPHIAPTAISGEPVNVTVNRLGISLPVIDGTYDKATDSWTLSDDKAQFATMTQMPNNQAGNTFIYGHNTDQVFMRLAGLKTGDVAQIKTSNGHEFSYVYNGQEIVQPDNTKVLTDQPLRPRLTLMTCDGVLSLTRRIMIFDFTKVS